MTERAEGALSEADRAALKWVKLPSGINALEALEALEAELKARLDAVHDERDWWISKHFELNESFVERDSDARREYERAEAAEIQVGRLREARDEASKRRTLIG